MSNDRRQIVEALTEERAGLVWPDCHAVAVSLVFDGGALCLVFSLLVG
jgi:hypothetical protein